MADTTTATVKQTVLFPVHLALGAKMTPFAGWDMPVRYSGDKDEHLAVRKAVGLFDVSHMGEFMVRGPQAQELIQRLTSNDVTALFPGKVQYSTLVNLEGGIVDDLLVYMIDAENYMLVVNAGNIDKDWAWVNQHNTNGAILENRSDELALLALQGPNATAVLQQLTDVAVGDMPYYTFQYGTVAGIEGVNISVTGYTGAGGYELYVPNAAAEKLWHALMTAGADHGIKPCGLGARDTLRLEMGFCLYGNDIDDTTTPLEAGLGWVTKLKKGAVNGSEVLNTQKANGLTRKLVGFVLQDRGIARGGYAICDLAGNPVGRVTSGAPSPLTEQSIGMGYVPLAMAEPGTEIFIDVRGKLLVAVVTKVPFI